MSNFSVNCSNLKKSADDFIDVKNSLHQYRNQISSICNNLALSGDSRTIIRQRILDILNDIDRNEASLSTLSETLIQIVEEYQTAENNILQFQFSNNASSSAPPAEEENNTDDTDDASALQEAIDFLNGLSMSTSIDGLTLSIIKYLLQLYNNDIPTGGLDSFGNVAGYAGLITGVAADIMNGYQQGLSQNAVIADILTDIVLWGIGAGAPKIGEVIGTAVGGPIGTIVGSFVGGVVGNGVGIIMNIDFDGDGETGKDALSDSIDDLLDNFIGDQALPLTA